MSRQVKEKHGIFRAWLFSFRIAAEINMVEQNDRHNLLKISQGIFVLITGCKCAYSKAQRCILYTFKSDASCQLLKSSFLIGKITKDIPQNFFLCVHIICSTYYLYVNYY